MLFHDSKRGPILSEYIYIEIYIHIYIQIFKLLIYFDIHFRRFTAPIIINNILISR